MTSIETGPSWVERLNPRHWTLVWKLVIVGLVPALLALTLGALRIADQAGSAADLGRSGKLLDLHTQVAAAGDALRQERNAATLYVASNRTGDRGQLTTADTRSDDALSTMRAGVPSAGNLDQATAVAVAQANGVVGQLPALRRDVTDNTVALPAVRDRYSRVIEGVDVLDRAVLRAVRVPDTAGRIDALTALQNVEAQLAVQHTVLGNAIRAGKLQDGDANAASSADVQIFAQYRAYQVALTPDQLERYGSFLDDPSNAERQRLTIAILTSAGKPDLGGVTAADWDDAYKNAKAVADRSANLIRDDLVVAATTASQQASNLAGINSVVLMLGLLIGISIAVLVARSLIRSLRVLRSSALDVAERRLPQAVENMRAGEAPDVTVEPVPIRTRDEVGQVARAFDAVHGQAVRLAADQAMLQANVSSMFVNLSRRSQALVERQLQLIEALESNEQDADQLSNLFQLDHLATRMRRNSENLLVLAGTDLAKRNMAAGPDGRRAARGGVRGRAVPARGRAGAARGVDRGTGGLRPRAPARRAAGQRHELLPARLTGGHERHPHTGRLDGHRDLRPRRRHGRPRARRRQPAPRRPVEGGRVRVPPHGPVRGRTAGRAARHRCAARQRGGRSRHGAHGRGHRARLADPHRGPRGARAARRRPDACRGARAGRRAAGRCTPAPRRQRRSAQLPVLAGRGRRRALERPVGPP